eukprot:g3500.t1
MMSCRPADVPTNKNTNWLDSPSAWFWYVSMIVATWLALSVLVEGGFAWTYVHLIHGVVTFYLLHWNKGSPVEDDQGKWDALTFWEQLNDEEQGTMTRKFFTVVPVVLFILATHGSDFKRQPLFLNLLIVVVLVVAKIPSMHKVRIFGINKY